MIKNPLYSRIQTIALDNIKDRRIYHTVFSEIRNKGSIRIVLDDLGYVPDNAAKPVFWMLKIDVEPAKKELKSAVRTPHKSSAYQIVLKSLRAKGVYYTAEFPGRRTYLSCLISRLKEQGYKIKHNKVGSSTVSYELVNEQ